jgi:hypothetical protein
VLGLHQAFRSPALGVELDSSSPRLGDATGHVTATQTQPRHADIYHQASKWGKTSTKTKVGSSDALITTSREFDFPDADINFLEPQAGKTQTQTHLGKSKTGALTPSSMPPWGENTAFMKPNPPSQGSEAAGHGKVQSPSPQQRHSLKRRRDFNGMNGIDVMPDDRVR